MEKIRIFKNRGDIYIPSADLKSDKEKRILLIALAFIIVFTIVFLLIFGIKYDFSVKNFFTPENMEKQNEEIVEQLPEVSGKTNYLFVLSNKNTNEMFLCSLIQVDMDTVSYKTSCLSAETQIDGKNLFDIYKTSGAGGVLNELNGYLGIDIDYYIDESFEDYKDMFNAMGSVNYTVLNDIKYKDTSRYGYNIKIKAGERKFDGDSATKLLRYYIEQEQNFSAANDFMLAALTQQISSESYEKREALFSKFIECSQTNITVKNFTLGTNAMKVLSSPTTGVNVYSAPVKYEGNILTSSSTDDLKGYFMK